MIIHTKYRDIPWDEARKCGNALATEQGGGEDVCCKRWEEERRNRPVAIETPPCNDRFYFACEGPVYRCAAPEVTRGVCPHTALIGD